MEELGLHSSKSQPLFGLNTAPKQEASKSLGLGDILTYLQKHFNQILEQKNPAYVFEFDGYEKDDLKLVSDIDKIEVDTWKSLNEKRIEKGMDPIDLTKVKNPADIPMNVQAVQLWQSQQGGGMGGMGGSPFEMGDDEGFGDEEGAGEDAGNIEGEGNEAGEPETEGGDTAGGGNGWDEIEAQQQSGKVEKSMSRKNVVRITV